MVISAQNIKSILSELNTVPYQRLNEDKVHEILNSSSSLAEIFDREMKDNSENNTLNNFIVVYKLVKLFIENSTHDVSIGVIRINRYTSKFILFCNNFLYDPDLYLTKHVGFLRCCRISDINTYMDKWYTTKSYVLKFPRITSVTCIAKKYFSEMEVL